MSKLSKKDLERRNLLKAVGGLSGSAIFRGPLAIFLQSVFGGMSYSAQAQGANPRKYLVLDIWGAPSRWDFDLFLNPYKSDGYTQSPGVANRYVAQNGRYVDSEYVMVERKGLQVPWMWETSVPASNGGHRPLDELLDYGLFLQGIKTNNPDHIGATMLHYRPSGASPSLPALSADAGNRPIPAINLDASPYSFVSKKGKSFVKVAYDKNPLVELMKPFTASTTTNFDSLEKKIGETMDRAIAMVAELKKTHHPLAETISISRSGATDLFKGGFSDLTKRWAESTQAYHNLINRAYSETVAGINDQPIGVPQNERGMQYLFNIPNDIPVVDDVRDMFASENVQMSGLAEGLAMAEFAFVEGISDSVCSRIEYARGFSQKYGQERYYYGTDHHSTGSMVTPIGNHYLYRAISSCLLEFTDRMKAAGKWQDIVVDLASEFSRSPISTGQGSDHGWQGKNVALYSGAFKGPLVLGNIMKDNPNPRYSGTWGDGGVVDELGKQLGLDHFAATLAHCLRTQSPVTSATTLVVVGPDGTITPVIAPTKIV